MATTEIQGDRKVQPQRTKSPLLIKITLIRSEPTIHGIRSEMTARWGDTVRLRHFGCSTTGSQVRRLTSVVLTWLSTCAPDRRVNQTHLLA